MKQCTRCGIRRDLSEYHRKGTRNGKPRYQGVCKECRKDEPDRVRSRDLYLQRTYDITAVEYETLHTSQGGSCAVCGTHEADLGRPLVVDHCHARGHVRGLLCDDCNLSLGKFKDDPAILEAAASYLRRNQ